MDVNTTCEHGHRHNEKMGNSAQTVSQCQDQTKDPGSVKRQHYPLCNCATHLTGFCPITSTVCRCQGIGWAKLWTRDPWNIFVIHCESHSFLSDLPLKGIIYSCHYYNSHSGHPMAEGEVLEVDGYPRTKHRPWRSFRNQLIPLRHLLQPSYSIGLPSQAPLGQGR